MTRISLAAGNVNNVIYDADQLSNISSTFRKFRRGAGRRLSSKEYLLLLLRGPRFSS